MNERDQELYQLNIQMNFYMDSVAQQKQYDNALSCISYSTSSEESWKLQAQAFADWRTQCWIIINNILGSLTPEQPVPTIEEIIPQLPVIVWPQ